VNMRWRVGRVSEHRVQKDRQSSWVIRLTDLILEVGYGGANAAANSAY